MAGDRVIKASEMEETSPDEPERVVNDNSLESLNGLDPAFCARVKAKSRRILEERGLLDTDRS